MRRILVFAFLFLLGQDLAARLPALIPYRKGNLWGYCDSTRKMLIPARYDKAGLFSGNTAIAFYGQKQVIVDQQGKEIALPDSIYVDELEAFHGVRIFSSAFYRCTAGLINEQGKVILKQGNFWLNWISENYLFAQTEDDKMAVYDFHGRQVLGFNYEYYDYNPAGDPNGKFILCKKGLCGLVDTNGRIIIPFKYPFLRAAGCSYYRGEKKNHVDVFSENGEKLWSGGFTNSPMEESCLAEEEKQDSMQGPKEWNLIHDRAGIQIGFVNAKGDTLLEPEYDYIDFSGLAGLPIIGVYEDAAKKKIHYLGYIDRYGTKYWDFD